MAGLNNSDGCRPPQPKFLLCQSLPQTLQPSEFVIFVAAEDVEDSSSYSEFNADAPVDHFRFARYRLRTATIPASGFQRRFTEAVA
jgi:hypothetical protein